MSIGGYDVFGLFVIEVSALLGACYHDMMGEKSFHAYMVLRHQLIATPSPLDSMIRSDQAPNIYEPFE